MHGIISNADECDARMTPVRQLHLHLMSFPTATSALAAWISARGLGFDPIRAKVISQDYQNDRAKREGTLATRCVRLVCGPHVVSQATIVYREYLLSDALRHQLHSTDLPFGEVIKSLGPSRRTTFARAISPPMMLMPDDPVNAFTPILELHATVLTADHGPIARVREIYGACLLLNMTSEREHSHATPRNGALAEA